MSRPGGCVKSRPWPIGSHLRGGIVAHKGRPDMSNRVHCNLLILFEKATRLLLVGTVFGALMGALLTPRIEAQSTAAELIGSVKDASGAVLPGVALTITNEASGQERRLVTDNSGGFVAASLPVGSYTVKAELANFKTLVRTGIVLQVAQQIR